MPYGFVHGDTAQQLSTALKLVEQGFFDINPKKTFLTPLLYSISAVAHIPVLYFAAALQHFFGVLLVVASRPSGQGVAAGVASLDCPTDFPHCRSTRSCSGTSTSRSRNSLMVFGTVSVASAGTFFYRHPNRYTLSLLFLAALFVAGARPEGQFLALFAIALVIRRLWGEWSRLKIYGPISPFVTCSSSSSPAPARAASCSTHRSSTGVRPPHARHRVWRKSCNPSRRGLFSNGENRSLQHIDCERTWTTPWSHFEAQGVTGRALPSSDK